MEYPCKTQCKGVTWCHPGLKGANADLTKLLFILHRPDDRIYQENLFGDEHSYLNVLAKTKTGETLGKLLTFCGLNLDDIYLTNALKCVFGNKSQPKHEDYARCKRVLENQVAEFEPKKIVGFGIPVRNVLFDNSPRLNTNGVYTGILLQYSKEKIPTLIVPHPSKIWALRDKRIFRVFKNIKDFVQN